MLSCAHLPRALLVVCFSCAPVTVPLPSPCGWRQAETGADVGLLLGSSLGLHGLSPLPPPSASSTVHVGTWQTTSGSLAWLNTSPRSSPSAWPSRWHLAEPAPELRMVMVACTHVCFGCVARLLLLRAGQSRASSGLEAWMSCSHCA